MNTMSYIEQYLKETQEIVKTVSKEEIKTR